MAKTTVSKPKKTETLGETVNVILRETGAAHVSLVNGETPQATPPAKKPAPKPAAKPAARAAARPAEKDQPPLTSEEKKRIDATLAEVDKRYGFGR